MLKQKLKTIHELWGVSGAKLEQYSLMLKDIPENELIHFSVFVIEHQGLYTSREKAIYEAVKSFRTKLILSRIREGKYNFSDIETMINFIKSNFKGKELCYGAGSFYDQVILALDENSDLVNKYRLNDFNKPSRLNAEDVADVYAWLFSHQNRIGVIRHIRQKEAIKEQIENNQDVKESKQVAQLLKGVVKKIKADS